MGRSILQPRITPYKRLLDVKQCLNSTVTDLFLSHLLAFICTLQMSIGVNGRQTFWGWKFGSMMQVAPTQSGHSSLLTMPWTWWRGKVWRMTSSLDQDHSETRDLTWRMKEKEQESANLAQHVSRISVKYMFADLYIDIYFNKQFFLILLGCCFEVRTNRTSSITN